MVINKIETEPMVVLSPEVKNVYFEHIEYHFHWTSVISMDIVE